MRILSKSGDYAYLVELVERQGVVLDISAEPTLSQVASLDTLMTAGPWEPFDGDPKRIEDLVYWIASEGVELPAIGFDVNAPARRLEGKEVLPSDLQFPLVKVLESAIAPASEEEGTFVFGNRLAEHWQTPVTR